MAALVHVGEVLYTVVESFTVVVQAAAGSDILNEGSILLREGDGVPLGLVHEVFGPVVQPFYLVRLDVIAKGEGEKAEDNGLENKFEGEDRKKEKEKVVGANRRKDPSIETRIQEQLSNFTKGTRIACLPSHATTAFVSADVLASIKAASGKGSDASNVYDEELPLEEQEFSDDEEEQAAKAAKKRGKKKKKDYGGSSSKYVNGEMENNLPYGQGCRKQNPAPAPPPPPPLPLPRHKDSALTRTHRYWGRIHKATRCSINTRGTLITTSIKPLPLQDTTIARGSPIMDPQAGTNSLQSTAVGRIPARPRWRSTKIRSQHKLFTVPCSSTTWPAPYISGKTAHIRRLSSQFLNMILVLLSSLVTFVYMCAK